MSRSIYFSILLQVHQMCLGTCVAVLIYIFTLFPKYDRFVHVKSGTVGGERFCKLIKIDTFLAEIVLNMLILGKQYNSVM